MPVTDTRGKLKEIETETAVDLKPPITEFDYQDKRISDEEISVHQQRETSKTLQKWLIRSGILAAVILISLTVVWYVRLPKRVDIVQPEQAVITETIASSGRVGGQTETNVGAQTSGIVEKLFVDEGTVVTRGQELALIKNDVAEAQVLLAQAAVNTARSQLVQVSRGSLGSDIEAASEQVRQAQAQVEQQNSAIVQAEKNVAQTRAQLAQSEAERDLAKKNLERSASLVEAGVVSKSEYDQSLTNFRVADKRVEAQTRAIELAESGVRSARSGLKSAQANVRTQQARLRTIQNGARTEDVRVAEQRVAEAERSLSVARRQAGNASVIAPFAGTVTKINAEEGQTVGANGVLSLVSIEPEIRLDVDESNLSTLRVGQEAVISSAAFSSGSFRGTVSELGAAVDQTRGTIQIKVVPREIPDWLRPGQTVNVNVITAENASRLLVPQTALIRTGDETVVFLIKNDQVVQKAVVTRPATKEGVPVISGLEPDDFIIKDATGLTPGDKVKAN